MLLDTFWSYNIHTYYYGLEIIVVVCILCVGWKYGWLLN